MSENRNGVSFDFSAGPAAEVMQKIAAHIRDGASPDQLGRLLTELERHNLGVKSLAIIGYVEAGGPLSPDDRAKAMRVMGDFFGTPAELKKSPDFFPYACG